MFYWRIIRFWKLVKECCDNIDTNVLIYNATLNDDGRICSSCVIYIVFLIICFLIIIGISSAFIYFHGYLQRSNVNTVTGVNPNIETIIY